MSYLEWQNLHIAMWAQQRLWSDWTSAYSESSLYAWRYCDSFATYRAHSEDWSEL